MRHYARRFPGTPEAIAATRRWTRTVLAELDCDETAVETAELIISELSTNAVRYSVSGLPGGSYRATVAHGAGQIRLEVADQGASGTPVVQPPRQDCDALHGRGLWMIQHLAIRLVIFGDEHGRVIFADIDAHHPTLGEENTVAPLTACASGREPGRVLHCDEPGVWAALIPAIEALIEPQDYLTRQLHALLEQQPPTTARPPGASTGPGPPH